MIIPFTTLYSISLKGIRDFLSKKEKNIYKKQRPLISCRVSFVGFELIARITIFQSSLRLKPSANFELFTPKYEKDIKALRL